ncbi:UNKNOWN [Stylonychia lemnae]|uniref:Uncharacterized protein n=1 Tax=Stylonychia lemnae TaxID=5949 RepID=A0A078A5R6_STYLE|nr:UNKNOWN [Stylonychia lemnae]|eukprot:CDW77529.1 UNKNOWN [Stylonychia lemnae]
MMIIMTQQQKASEQQDDKKPPNFIRQSHASSLQNLMDKVSNSYNEPNDQYKVIPNIATVSANQRREGQAFSQSRQNKINQNNRPVSTQKSQVIGMQTTQFSLSPYHYSGAGVQNNNGSVEDGIRIGAENKKSILAIQGQNRNTNIDLLAKKRQWELQNGQPVQHRESLQSRLLERITIKKQAQNEIFLQEEISSEEEEDDGETTNHQVQEEDQEDDDDNKTTERKSVAHHSKRKGTSDRVYTQDYDDENAADIEDADRVEDDEDEERDRSVSQIRKQNRKQGLFKEDLNSNTAAESMKKKFHFHVNQKQQSSTVYGSKFLDFRKTFQNFNANSNKALNIYGLSENQQQYTTHYGGNFKDGFNKKSSFQAEDQYGGININNGIYGNLNSNSAKNQTSSTNRMDGKGAPGWHKFAVTSNNFYDPRTSGTKNQPQESTNLIQYQQRFHSNRRIEGNHNNVVASNNNYGNNQVKPLTQAPGTTGGAQTAGRKTFYVSDQNVNLIMQHNMASRAGGVQNAPYQQIDNNGFTKPRALSRQADAHIKIEVHRDENIKNHLQREQRENMNLMFYDFNGSSQNQNSTGQNFYQSNGKRQNNKVEGDRLPTRERGYRSAQQNIRRRVVPNQNHLPQNQFEDLTQNVY